MVRRPPVSEQSTIVTPVESDPCRLMLQVEYFNTSIDLIQLRGLFEPAQLIDVDPLTVKWQGNSYAVIFRFGAVVFWRWSEKLASELAARISEVQELPAAVEQVSDNLAVRVGQPEDSVNFRDICLHTLTVEHIRIVSQSLAQSAALKHCEVCVADALSNIEPFISDLRDHGRLPPSSQEVFKRIGFTLTMRQTILSRLTMFDPPAETWSSQRLDRLHAALYEHFDISSRLATLEAKLDFLADLNQILTNLLQHSESRRLELVVILLIIAEVALAVYDFFIRSH